MEIKQELTKVNYTPMTNKRNEYIVIHYVGAVSSAKANADYFYSVNRNASANYFVDENEIWQVVKDSDKAWHVGADKYYNDCRNSNSIGIEMCCYMNNGKLDISDKVIERTIELTKYLMAKYNIPADRVVRHYDVTHKKCPAPFVENEARWNNFKERLTMPDLRYKSHIENIGWTEWVNGSNTIGSTGLRTEAIILEGHNGLDLQYRTHVENIGWTEWVHSGEISGTTGKALKIEAIEIKSNKLLEAQEFIERVGWMPISRGTEIHIGTQGKSLRLEAFAITVVK